MSSSAPPAPPRPKKDEHLPGCTQAEVIQNLQHVNSERRRDMELLLLEVDRGDFWTQKRRVQAIRLLRGMKAHGLFQKDIAAVLDVSETVISRYAKQLRKTPTENPPRSGPPSQLSDVFVQIANFIDAKNREHKAVTMGVLMAFVNDKLHIHVTKQALKMNMKRHDFCYTWATPTDQHRATVEAHDVEAYNNAMEEDIRGLHPALVFNMDEMGVELFADRKKVKVFLRPNQVPADGAVQVGLPRSARRCTLITRVSPNGDTMIPTILAKTKTVHSHLFDGGYSLKSLKFFSSENSFITGNIFSRLVNEVFLKKVEKKRARLRGMIGDFNDNVVLIMDGCSAHKIEPFMEVFAKKTDCGEVPCCPFVTPHATSRSRNFRAVQEHHENSDSIPHQFTSSR